eukprot:9467165-Pyramimonas_sp.AAC.2
MTLIPWSPMHYNPVVHFHGFYSPINKWLLIAALVAIAILLTPEIYLKVRAPLTQTHFTHTCMNARTNAYTNRIRVVIAIFT